MRLAFLLWDNRPAGGPCCDIGSTASFSTACSASLRSGGLGGWSPPVFAARRCRPSRLFVAAAFQGWFWFSLKPRNLRRRTSPFPRLRISSASSDVDVLDERRANSQASEPRKNFLQTMYQNHSFLRRIQLTPVPHEAPSSTALFPMESPPLAFFCSTPSMSANEPVESW